MASDPSAERGAGGARRATVVLVLADTHVTAARLDRMPGAVLDAAASADAIVHAGDVVERAVLDELGRHAPVHAVLGNNDRTLVGELPERTEVKLGGVRIGLVHDSGRRAGRRARLERWFPDADVIIFGHSHEPVVDRSADGGPLLLNPGSPTQRRRQPAPTFAVLTIEDGRADAGLVVVPSGR